jgi:trigger factor
MTVKSCEKEEKSTVALTVAVDAAEFEAAVQKAFLKNRKTIRIPGFRPGKAPRNLIEKMYGEKVFYDDAINIAIPDAYEAAVLDQKLRVVGDPKLELDGEVTKDGFAFKAVVPVYPEVTLGQYKGLSAPKDEVSVTDADVDARLKELTDRNTRLVSADKAAENGDVAVIDYQGTLEGKPFDGGSAESYSLELGSHSFVPGFEEQVVGMKAGEEKDIDVTFPQDYHKDLAGKAVVFHVKANEIKVKDVPALDDEFAKDVSEFDTIGALKDDIRKKITDEREKSAQQAFEDALMQQVAANITCDVPDAMVASQTQLYMNNLYQQLQQWHITLDQYLGMTGMDKDGVRKSAEENALKQVRLNLALTAIVEAEGLEASEDETEAEYQKVAEQYGLKVEDVKKRLMKEDVESEVKTRKAVAVVADSATATKPEPKEEPKTEEAPAQEDSAEDGEKPAAKKPARKPAAKKTPKADKPEADEAAETK